MANSVLLNNVDHQDLRVINRRAAELGDGQMFALTFPDEFRSIQAHYPIVFRKTAEGTGFEPIALLGLQAGQNLFLRDGRWDAAYLPLSLERQPFLIGRSGQELLVHIDLDSPRLSRSEGEALFLPHGGSSDYLQRINSVLLALHQGLDATPAFIQALQAHELLESFVLDVELNDGSQNRLAGFYTINEERLAGLPGSALEALARAGHLQAIYMAVASLSQLRTLIDRQNQV
ncbi:MULTISPECIES: SapC family protein [Roseateles]|uniref:SapC family protein n=1 Tax=Roseateles albus TaxID=2987525 RepID=A0ABT5K8J1_9BURK|nr:MULTISPECIES: SapC family protein [Roseateles]MCV2360759.1 SapC family protein [Paucibacter sp. TC2R-5]MDC8770183.1 SapC family protein [Roseateles albus]